MTRTIGLCTTNALVGTTSGTALSSWLMSSCFFAARRFDCLITMRKRSLHGTPSRQPLATSLAMRSAKKQHPQERLSRRFEAVNETSTAYIEGVLRLCCRVDADMSEENRLRHLFQGLSHDLFSGIASIQHNTVAALIVKCKRYENLRSGIIFYGSFEGLPEVMPFSPRADLSVQFVMLSGVRFSALCRA